MEWIPDTEKAYGAFARLNLLIGIQEAFYSEFLIQHYLSRQHTIPWTSPAQFFL